MLFTIVCNEELLKAGSEEAEGIDESDEERQVEGRDTGEEPEAVRAPSLLDVRVEGDEICDAIIVVLLLRRQWDTGKGEEATFQRWKRDNMPERGF